MYAYSNEHTPERKMVLSAYFQMLQAVVIENAVIYPLTGSAFTVNLFVLLGIPGDTWLEAQAAVILYVNGAPIAAGGTFSGMRTILNASASEWAAVFMCVFDRIIPPWAHFMSCFAKGMAIPAESDAVRCIFRKFSPAVDVNQRIYVPALQ